MIATQAPPPTDPEVDNHNCTCPGFLAGFPSHEEDSWQRLHDEALDRFFAGTYAGDYQAARL